jgi:chromosome segregation ATPase
LTARAERAVELEAELSMVKSEAEANAKSLTAQVDSARSDVGEALEALGAMEVELNKCREELEGKRAGEFEAAEGLAELLDHERNQVLRLEAEVGVLREAAAKREEDMASLQEARDADADVKSEVRMCICESLFVHVYLRMYAYIYIHVYVCIYVCIYASHVLTQRKYDAF